MRDRHSPVQSSFIIHDGSSGAVASGRWIHSLISLGSAAAECSRAYPQDQLVVAVSLPARDLAACLLSIGWIVAHPTSRLEDTTSIFTNLAPDSAVVICNGKEIIADKFLSLDPSSTGFRLRLRSSKWDFNRIQAATVWSESIDTAQRLPIPAISDTHRALNLDRGWIERLLNPPTRVAILSELKRLQSEMELRISPSWAAQSSASIADILLPGQAQDPRSFTSVFSSRESQTYERLDDLPRTFHAAILEGNKMIEFLGEIETDAVFCVLDRSIEDTSASETVVQFHNHPGTNPVSAKQLGWQAYPGVELVAFRRPR